MASGARLGLLGNKSIFDTPFTVTSYTSQLIRDQQAQTIADVVANNPSVRQLQSSFTGQQNYFIRGFLFNAREVGFDGLYGIVPIYRPALEGIERVEVLNGPSALLYGFSPSGNVGGVINMIPKRATDYPITRIAAQYMSNSNVGTAFDVGRRYGEANEFGVRANGLYRNGGTPVDNQNLETGFGSVGLDYRGDRFRASLDVGYQNDMIKAPSGSFTVAPGFAIPRAPDLSRGIAQPWERSYSESRYALARAEYDVLPNWTLFAAVGGSNQKNGGFGTTGRIVNAAGDITQTASTSQVGGAVQEQWTGEVGVRGKVQIGPVQHAISVVGTSYNSNQEFGGFVNGPVFVSNLYNPTYYPRPTFSGTAASRQHLFADSAAVTDTLSVLDERLQLLVGARYQSLRTDTFGPTGVFTSSEAGVRTSPLGALIVKPVKPLSLYVSYAEGFGFTATTPNNALNNPDRVLPPGLSKQIETGAKLDLGTIGMSLAFFEITRPNAFLDANLIFGFNGEQRNRGIDYNVFGEVAPGARILGGFTLLDGVLTKTANGAFDGKKAPGVPDVSINIGGEYDWWFAPGFTTSARVIYTSKQYYDQANLQWIPEWTRLDLGARYSWVYEKILWNARFNVENVTDLNYWASTGQGSLQQGMPRTFRLTLSADLTPPPPPVTPVLYRK